MKTATIRMTKGDTVAEVLLYDMIGRDAWFGDGVGAKEFREQLKAIKAPTVINLRINSPGGSVTEAAAMLAALDEHPSRIEVDIDGLAASAASVVAMAGDVVRVASNGLVMIHNPMSGAMGDANELRRTADLLDKVRGQIIDAYARKVTAGREQIGAWMDSETWFTGQEAVDAGLADSVTGAVSVQAMATFAPSLLAKLGIKTMPPQLQAATVETDKRRAIAARL